MYEGHTFRRCPAIGSGLSIRGKKESSLRKCFHMCLIHPTRLFHLLYLLMTQIGVNDRGQPVELGGCVDDTLNIKRFLSST